MDGLMVNTEPLQSKSFEQVLESYGKKPAYNNDGVVQVVGIGAKSNWIRMKKQYNLKESISVLLEKKNDIYKQLLDKKLVPQEGLGDLINELNKKNISLAVASSSTIHDIEFVLSKLGVRKYFKAVVSGDSVPHGKPAPDIFLQVAKELKVEPKQCVVLEDSQSGVEAAKRAGMKVIAVPNKYTKSSDFSKADMVVSSLLTALPLLLYA